MSNFNWVPLDVAIEEDDDGVFRPGVVLDLVVPWRIGDGAIVIATVQVESEEQIDLIMDWARRAAENFREELAEKSKDLFCRDHIVWPKELA